MKNYWVISNETAASEILVNEKAAVLKNSLAERKIDFEKGTTSFKNLTTGVEYIEEAGADVAFSVNGNAFELQKDFAFSGAKPVAVCSRLEYAPSAFTAGQAEYPPKGKALLLTYENEELLVEVRYEIYDSLPAISKFATIENRSEKSTTINSFVLDRLNIGKKNQSMFYAETSYNGGCSLNNNRTLSVDYSENQVSLHFDIGPDAVIAPGEKFESMWGYELLHTAEYYEQKLIEVKRSYRKLFPWVLDSPLIFHVLSDRSDKVRAAIDEAAECGFDMVIQSFGSGIDVENHSPKYIQRHRELNEYAKSKGVRLGAYTLAIVRDYKPILSDECNVYADPKSRIMRCLATEWSEGYWNKVITFFDKTGYSAIEIDGPYHFYLCSGGKTHLHRGLSDSRFLQWKKSTVEVMRELKKRGIYINAPDWLFMSGVNKTGIGYEETAFSQPRHEQLIASRIYNYKGTFGKIPSMGWGFVPIDVYHGGGRSASFAPLTKNHKDYDWALFQNLVSGVLPCFRGKKLFDSEETKATVKKWVGFYKKYKEIINGTTIHFLPPVMNESNRGQTAGVDAVLNVVANGETRGILAIFNQTDKPVRQAINVPLFYAGLGETKAIPPPAPGGSLQNVKHPSYGEYPPPYPVSSEADIYEAAKVTGYGKTQILSEKEKDISQGTATKERISLRKEGKEEIILNIDSNAEINLEINLEPMSYTWYVIKKA